LLDSEAGAELRVLVEELADLDDAEWLLEEGRVDQRMATFRGAMEVVLRSYTTRRMTPPLEQTSTSTFFRFAVRDDADEDDDVRALRARLRLHDQMLVVLRALDPADFELLCGRVLREVGCEVVHVTRSSQDLGADFFGRVPVGVLTPRPVGVPPRLRVLGGVYLLLFGQAKRYADYKTINLDTVKMLEGTWNDILRRKLNNELPQHLVDGLQEIGWRAADGVTLVFVTTSSYTDPALTWAANAGMATLDGDQITQLLLECGVGVEQADEGVWSTNAGLVTAACAA
jgi:hypothetical protein